MYRVPLGPFEFEEPVGKGGMGEVWRGVHLAQGTAVAIKVLTREGVRKKAYLESFRNEVYAVARLNHPGIITVLDYGLITAQAERASHHRMVEGSPYLVMEYARHGSLFEFQESLRWEELRSVLFTVLDALAHAHARGVIHRDMKPQNILIGCGEDEGVTIADFGLAHAVHDENAADREDIGWGTPHYMAPEQFRGHWRDYGAWTDLYALGCMAFELATGHPPFHGGSSWDLGRAHILEPMPRMFTRFPVPEAFESWVMRLLQKHPADRFLRAADAALALSRVGELDARGRQQPRVLFTGRFGKVAQEVRVWDEPSEPQEGVAPTVQINDAPEVREGARALSGRLPALDWESYSVRADEDHIDTQPRDLEPAQRLLPRAPRSWQQASMYSPSMQLTGAGLGLYGLRQVELVGRASERDALWSLFSKACEQGSPHAVLLRGAAGVGKSHLAQWITERLHELGLATILKATYGAVKGPFDGLSPMFARHQRVMGMEYEDAILVLRQWMQRHNINVEDYEDESLAFAILPPEKSSQVPSPARSGFLSHAQRFGLFKRHLMRVAQERPVVLWLDDVQWGAEGLFFARYLLSQIKAADAQLPLVVLMTMREEGLLEGSLEQMLLGELATSARFSSIELSPLPDDDFEVLVNQLLGLEPKLAQEVQARAQGVPLFAVQLVGDWVARGKLEVAKAGFALKPGERADLPDDIHAIWRARHERFFQDRPTGQVLCTQLAAALGLEISFVEWELASRYLGEPLSDGLLDDLNAAGLIEAVDGGQAWLLCHGMMRESLERMAREQGAWPALNLAIAKMLKALYREPDAELHVRMARHLIEAGSLDQAIFPMLQASKLYLAQSELAVALRLLDELEGMLNQLSLPESDERRGRVWVMRSRVFDQQGKYLEALRWASTAIKQAQQYKWIDVLLDATIARAYAAMHRGSTEEAQLLFEQTMQHTKDLSLEGISSLIGLGRVAQRRGELGVARDYFMRGLKASQQLPDATAAATCLNGLGDIARQAGDFEAALDFALRALEGAEALKHAVLIADCHNDLAELYRLQGDCEKAAPSCVRAISIYESVESDQSWRAKMNYAFILLGLADYEQATAQLRVLFDRFRVNHDYSQLALASVGVLPCLAHLGQWAKLESATEQARRLLKQTGRRDSDVVFACELAASLAMDAQERELAALLTSLAEDFGPRDPTAPSEAL